MAKVEGVAAAGKIHVIALIARNEVVVRCIVDAAPGQRRAHLVAFGSMIVDHVENDFDSRRVQDLYKGLEFP